MLTLKINPPGQFAFTGLQVEAGVWLGFNGVVSGLVPSVGVGGRGPGKLASPLLLPGVDC